MMNKELATVISGKLPAVITPADFSALDQVITKLGEHAGNLAEKEKEFAVQAIGEWEDLVVKRVNANNTRARAYLGTIKGTEIHEDILLELAGSAGLAGDVAEYNKLSDEIAEHRLNKPQYGGMDPEATMESNMRGEYDYQRDDAIWNRKYRQLVAIQSNMQESIRRKLVKADGVSELKDKLSAYVRGTDSSLASCREKAQLAKVSVSISNEDARVVLKDLIGFAATV